MHGVDFMQQALEQAEKAALREEVPIGAVMVYNQEIIAAFGNETRLRHDPTAHAEILAIRAACEVIGAQRIPECDLYVTLEPCAMCAAAISFARIRTLVIGALDEKGGAVLNGVKFFNQPTCHHKRIDIQRGVRAVESAALLKKFFSTRR